MTSLSRLQFSKYVAQRKIYSVKIKKKKSAFWNRSLGGKGEGKQQLHIRNALNIKLLALYNYHDHHFTKQE